MVALCFGISKLPKKESIIIYFVFSFVFILFVRDYNDEHKER